MPRSTSSSRSRVTCEGGRSREPHGSFRPPTQRLDCILNAQVSRPARSRHPSRRTGFALASSAADGCSRAGCWDSCRPSTRTALSSIITGTIASTRNSNRCRRMPRSMAASRMSTPTTTGSARAPRWPFASTRRARVSFQRSIPSVGWLPSMPACDFSPRRKCRYSESSMPPIRNVEVEAEGALRALRRRGKPAKTRVLVDEPLDQPRAGDPVYPQAPSRRPGTPLALADIEQRDVALGLVRLIRRHAGFDALLKVGPSGPDVKLRKPRQRGAAEEP